VNFPLAISPRLMITLVWMHSLFDRVGSILACLKGGLLDLMQVSEKDINIFPIKYDGSPRMLECKFQ
jgi:hypothetical protein